MSTVRLGALVAAVGGALLILSEIVEVVGGGFSPTHFALTIAAFFVLSVGIWGLHAGQAPKGGRLSLLGAALFSVGSLSRRGGRRLRLRRGGRGRRYRPRRAC